MRTNSIKRVLAVALSATMIFASAVTVFAAPENGVDASTAGTGNVLAYKIISQVVPTALKVAINPNGYAVNIRYAKLASDASYSATTKYYKEKAGGGYELVTVSSTDFATEKANLYTATTSNVQIVTFNYGLANKSTVDRKVLVKLDVTADSNVEFVDTAAKATNEAETDDGGAKQDEYKIYLTLVPAKAGEAITTSTYAKTTGDYNSSGVYYTRTGSAGSYTYSKVETNSEDDFKDGKYYVAATQIGTEIQASELGDVTMQASSAPIVFAAGKGTTNADVAYKLGKGTFDLKSTEFIDFDTETDDVAAKFEMTGIGGVSGFTISGTMNTNTKWDELETKTITITPTYKITDATGLEEAVSTGLNQVKADARSFTVTYKPNFTGSNVPDDITETVTAGSKATGKIDDKDIIFTRDGYTLKGWGTADSASAAANLTEDDKVTVTDIDKETTLYAIWEETNPTPAITGTSKVTGEDWQYTATFTQGTAKTLSATGLTACKWGNAVNDISKTSENITIADGVLTIGSSMWSTVESGTIKYLSLTIGGKNYIVKVTVQAGT